MSNRIEKNGTGVATTETGEEAQNLQALELTAKQRESLRQHTLGERGLLVSVKMGRFANAKCDREATTTYAGQQGISDDAVRVNKTLFGKSVITRVSTPYNQAREYARKTLLPWEDGKGFIAIGMYQEFRATMHSYFDKIDKAVAEVVDEWPDLLREAEQMLGKLFDPADYPTPEDFRKAWHHELVVEQIPSTDVRVAMNDAARKDLEQQIARHVAENAAKAWGSCAQQLAESLLHVAKILQDEGSESKRKAPIHNSLLENMTLQAKVTLTMAEAIGDKELQALAQRVVKATTGLSADVLRANPEFRKRMGKAVAELAEQASVEAAANESKTDSLFEELEGFATRD